MKQFDFRKPVVPSRPEYHFYPDFGLGGGGSPVTESLSNALSKHDISCAYTSDISEAIANKRFSPESLDKFLEITSQFIKREYRLVNPGDQKVMDSFSGCVRVFAFRGVSMESKAFSHQGLNAIINAASTATRNLYKDNPRAEEVIHAFSSSMEKVFNQEAPALAPAI